MLDSFLELELHLTGHRQGSIQTNLSRILIARKLYLRPCKAYVLPKTTYCLEVWSFLHLRL